MTNSPGHKSASIGNAPLTQFARRLATALSHPSATTTRRIRQRFSGGAGGEGMEGGEASFYTWVYRIAMNESIGVYRRPGSSLSLDELARNDESHLLAKILPEESVDKTFADKEDNARALQALGRVHEPYREILELYFLQDLSYERIAKKLHIPEGTVMSRLHRARKLLQDSWRGKKTPTLAKQHV